jgi:hypothetical protein
MKTVLVYGQVPTIKILASSQTPAQLNDAWRRFDKKLSGCVPNHPTSLANHLL